MFGGFETGNHGWAFVVMHSWEVGDLETQLYVLVLLQPNRRREGYGSIFAYNKTASCDCQATELRDRANAAANVELQEALMVAGPISLSDDGGCYITCEMVTTQILCVFDALLSGPSSVCSCLDESSAADFTRPEIGRLNIDCGVLPRFIWDSFAFY